jgi:hypothetical protein
MSKRVQVSLTIADGADLQQVANALGKAGLAVGEVMEGLGIITGEADETALAALRATRHVEAVEQSRRIKLPPKDSPIQ